MTKKKTTNNTKASGPINLDAPTITPQFTVPASMAPQVSTTQATPSNKKPHICVATPCYGGQVFQNYFLSIISLIYAVERRKDVDISFIVRGGDSLITRSRNSIVAE